jgi:hypothetical protein
MVSEIPGMPGMVEVSDEDLTEDERALVEWAKGDIRPNFDHPSTLHGAEAAESGRKLLEAALGGPENLRKVLGGRPPLDPAAPIGARSPIRQVRLPATMNTELSELAAAEGRRASEIIREALAAYLASHRAS